MHDGGSSNTYRYMRRMRESAQRFVPVAPGIVGLPADVLLHYSLLALLLALLLLLPLLPAAASAIRR
jgi:hypothetical protein